MTKELLADNDKGASDAKHAVSVAVAISNCMICVFLSLAVRLKSNKELLLDNGRKGVKNGGQR